VSLACGFNPFGGNAMASVFPMPQPPVTPPTISEPIQTALLNVAGCRPGQEGDHCKDDKNCCSNVCSGYRNTNTCQGIGFPMQEDTPPLENTNYPILSSAVFVATRGDNAYFVDEENGDNHIKSIYIGIDNLQVTQYVSADGKTGFYCIQNDFDTMWCFPRITGKSDSPIKTEQD